MTDPTQEPSTDAAGSGKPDPRRRASGVSGAVVRRGTAAAAKAAGVGGAEQLLTPGSSSDGTAAGDVKELGQNVATGARVGGQLAAAPGAAIGAAAGAAAAMVKNKRTRRRLLWLIAAPTVAMVVVWALILVSVAGMLSNQAQTEQQLSLDAVAADGLSADDVADYQAAAESSGVSWTLLAAVDRAAGGWTGPGQPPYGITDLVEFNAALVKVSIDPLSVEESKDRVAAGYAYGRLFAATLSAATPDVDPFAVDAGAGIMADFTGEGRVRGVDPDDADASDAHAATKTAYEATLAVLPSSTAADATAIFDAAYQWSIGQRMSCGPDAFSQGGGVPVPSGNPDAKLAFRAASWNVLKSNSVSRVASGLQAVSRTADVIGLQEFREKFRGATVKKALPGWAWSNQNTSVPITWNAGKFDLVAKSRVLEFGVTRVAGGPVGRAAGPKFAEWVQLRDKRTGASFVFVNHHLLYNIESKGHPDKRVGKKYLALAQKQMRVERDLVDQFAALDLPVVVTKDGNWDYRKSAKTQHPASPYVQAARHGLYTNWQVLGMPKQGTQSSGTRLIDSASSTTALLIPVQQTILGTPQKRFYGSDHRPPVVSLTNSGSFNSDTTATNTTSSTATTTASTTAGQRDVPNVEGLSDDQMNVAQTIYVTTLEVGREQGWPAADINHAFRIAVSTAQKESTLGADPNSRQPDGNGDGGIFAQRTKPGWYGTIDQVNDAAYGTRIFLLGKKVTAADVADARRAGTQPAGPAGYTIPGLKQVHGWPQLSISEASHRIQRSAYPTMPAAFEKIASALVRAFAAAGLTATSGSSGDQALTGGCENESSAGTTSGLDCPATSMPAEQYELTPDALLVTRCVAQQFPRITTIGTYPNHDPDVTRAVDIMIPDYETDSGKALGLQIRDWVQQHAAQLGVDYVIWNEQIWSTKRTGEGWRQCGTAAANCYSGPDDSASHRNHVHVSVFGAQGTGFASGGSDVGTGACPLDAAYAPGHKNPADCNQALSFLQRQDVTNAGQWYRSCLALVANAYGWGYSGVGTAGQHALLLKAAGKLHTTRTDIPRGAVLWWTNSGAGHVAVYAGDGYIYSNDAVTAGQVSRVAWDLPEKQWGQHFEGWSAPYFPRAGGTVA